jgi:DNA-binding MarR family transcriptional regulator
MTPVDTAKAIGAECLCFRARRVSRVLTRLYDEALRPLGVQATQLTLMSGIAGAGERGQSMARLTEMLAMDPTTLSRNLKPLEKAGLAVVGRAEGDRRVRVARLTEEGERVLADALPLWRSAQDRLVEALGSEAAIDLKQRLDATSSAAPATG